MRSGFRHISSAHRLGPDDLACGVLEALGRESSVEALELAVTFCGRYGEIHPEAHVLCALALERAGYAREALKRWDELFCRHARHVPEHVTWLAQALRAAWKREGECEDAARLARRWLGLLERVFVAAPPPELLMEMAGRGWQGSGSAGIHQGRLRAWIWLPEGEAFRVSISSGGPKFSLGRVRRTTLDSHVLHEVNAPLPASQIPFFLSLTDAAGRHVQGSPLACSPPRAAVPFSKKRVSGRRRGGITVIIPVYDDRRAVLACLASVLVSLKQCRTAVSVLVMWDHGPDARLHADLKRLAQRGKIILRETPVNLGFLACVNQALALVPEGDVILLNADTLVHGDWIDRMARAAAIPDAATVTALGSNAELVSFPSPSRRGRVRHPGQVRILDTACRALPPEEAIREIPVGVGFCMAITRRALDSIGGLDGLNLFSGYGEEVDFCLRAKEAGLKNYAALNVFVAHLGGRSFGPAKKALAAQNNNALFSRYPAYERDYDLFVLEDSLRPVRERISRHACEGLFRGCVLHVRPWSEMSLPLLEEPVEEMEEAEETGQKRETWAALFVLRHGVTSRAVLRTRHDVPLADMTFLLPAEADQLHDVVRRCGFTSVRAYSGCSRSLLQALDLPPCGEASSVPSLLPPFVPTRGTCLVAPPRSVKNWKRLCALALGHGHTVFRVHRLDALWGDAPRPANVRDLPDCMELPPLGPSALLLMNGADEKEVRAWRRWLDRRSGAAIPICAFPVEAA